MINPLISIAIPPIFAALLSISSSSVVAMPTDISFPSQFLNTENAEYKERPDRPDPTDRLWLAGITDPQEVVTFLENLRSAAGSNDRQALVSLVHYPFTTYNRGIVINRYNTTEDLLVDFDQIFTPKVLTAINNVQYNNLFVNSQGVMIGSGEIWFFQYPEGIRIKAVNG
jgi:hypothetical protein